MRRERPGRRWPCSVAMTALVSTLVVAGARPVHAADVTEPYNNFEPWNVNASHLAAVYVADAGQSIYNAHNIGSPTDHDWIVLGCGFYGNGTTPEYLDRVWIEFTHSVGDLDIDVWTLGSDRFNPGQELGYSAGVTNSETVTIAGKHNIVALHVMGFQGAQGPYSVHYRCKTAP